MPEQVLPTVESFSRFEEELKKRGFRKISKGEFKKQYLRLGLKAPRPRHGREVGYTFHANQYTVVVWTTWIEREQSAREEDAGWVLIAKDDEVLYFSHPLHRTKNFINNLLMQARIACWKVRNRPLCPECKNFMDIVKGQALKQRFWKCSRSELHKGGKNRFRDWDYGLPEEAIKYLKPLRKRRAKYYAALRAVDKEPHKAMLKRKKWR